MIWRFIKSLPKIALVLGVFLVSTGMFAYWWYFHSPVRREENRVQQEKRAEQIRKTAAEVEARMGHLLLLDDDVYDLDTGTLFFQHWLSEGVPKQLYFDVVTKKLIAFYGGGYVRYALDGKKEASIAGRYPMAFSTDLKWVVFSREKDIWRADVDWNGWKLINEKKLTSAGAFFDQYFVTNLVFGTEKNLVVRTLNQLLRINLDTGELHPTKPPLIKNRKQRSPDSKSLVGLEKNEFYCYDVDSEGVKTVPVARRSSIADYQWLDNDHCLCITAAGRSLIIYDRLKNTLEEVLPLPAHCNKIAMPSPNKRFVFCGELKTLLLVDLEQKTAASLSGLQGFSWVSDDSFVFARDIADSTLRGTWLQRAGSGERRVSEEPFIVRSKVKPILIVKSAGLVIFITKKGVMRMKPDGTELGQVVRIAAIPGRPPILPSRMTQIEEWKSNRGSDEEVDETAADQ